MRGRGTAPAMGLCTNDWSKGEGSSNRPSAMIRRTHTLVRPSGRLLRLTTAQAERLNATLRQAPTTHFTTKEGWL